VAYVTTQLYEKKFDDDTKGKQSHEHICSSNKIRRKYLTPLSPLYIASPEYLCTTPQEWNMCSLFNIMELNPSGGLIMNHENL